MFMKQYIKKTYHFMYYLQNSRSISQPVYLKKTVICQALPCSNWSGLFQGEKGPQKM